MKYSAKQIADILGISKSSVVRHITALNIHPVDTGLRGQFLYDDRCLTAITEYLRTLHGLPQEEPDQPNDPESPVDDCEHETVNPVHEPTQNRSSDALVEMLQSENAFLRKHIDDLHRQLEIDARNMAVTQDNYRKILTMLTGRTDQATQQDPGSSPFWSESEPVPSEDDIIQAMSVKDFRKRKKALEKKKKKHRK